MTVVSIADQLKVLIEFQELDAQVYHLNQQLAEKPAIVVRLKAEHEQTSQSLHAAEAQYKALEVKRNQMEMDLSKKEGEVQKLQGQLFQLKTNKEYSAMQKGIEGLKADNSVLEEEILKLMEEIDRAKERMLTERQNLKNREVSLAAGLAQLDEETKKIKSSIEQLQAARKSLTPKVELPVLARYERILENKGERALVPVKEDSCGGCHMVLPPQLINEVYLATRLVTCESCARILYIESNS